MATSRPICEVKKGLATAAACREDTKMLMQPYVNWEEYLTPAPMSIAILSELVFISSNTDFSIRKGGPEGGFKYLKYPDSFRACLMQVCNSGWRAFNEAHKNMDQIRLYTSSVPTYIKTAVQILLQDDDKFVQAMLPGQLDNIRNIADECVNLSQSTETRFTDVIELIHELLETSTSAKQVYGENLEEVRRQMYEYELRKKTSEEANKRAKKAFDSMEKQLEETEKNYKTAMNSMPNGWEMMAMNLVEGLSGNVTSLISGVTSLVTSIGNIPTMSPNNQTGMIRPDVKNDQISANNIYSQSSVILDLIKGLDDDFFNGDQIKQTEIIDKKTKKPKPNFTSEVFVGIQESIKKEEECKPKEEALKICIDVIKICSALCEMKPKEKPDDAKTKQIVQLLNSLKKRAMNFDTKSKSATNTTAFNINPPHISKTQDKSSDSKSAGQMAADNCRFQIEQCRAQLDNARKLYEKQFDNIAKNEKEMTEILVVMRKCEVKELDFDTTITILAQGLKAMGNLKEQWQKMVRFFQMVSNLIKSCMGTRLKALAKTGETALTTNTCTYTSRMFLKDIIYKQAFQASNIASLVNMIAGTYTEVSDKYLMDAVSRLSKLMALDVNDPQFTSERKKMADSCEEAAEGISRLVKKNKQTFEMKTKERLDKIESGMNAVLPPVSEEKKREIREEVEKASKDVDQFA